MNYIHTDHKKSVTHQYARQRSQAFFM